MGHRDRRLIRSILLFAIVAGLCAPGAAQERVHGKVILPDGAPVPYAQVGMAGSHIIAATDRSGRFTLPVSEWPVTLLLQNERGQTVREIVVAADHSADVTIVMPSSELIESITVIATPVASRLSDTAASVWILGRDDLDDSAALTLDDSLRQVPGFTLFRRSGSRTANPTAQGVSLRGVGASGASRSLVLDDGFPLNDPFGGWVYWGSVPTEAIDRVEVVRGGTSDLYGSGALAGVVGVVRRPAGESLLSASLSGGDSGTGSASLYWASGGDRLWRSAIALDAFTTDGYVPVAASQRGAADSEAGSERWMVEGTLDRALPSGRLFGRLSLFDEVRENGTELQRNETQILRGYAGLDTQIGDTWIEGRLSATDQNFDQTFSAVADDRNSERLVRVQEVPASSLRASARALHAVDRASFLSGGVDVVRVEGRSEEAGPPFTATSSTGGRQTTTGVWLHDEIQLPRRTSLTLALRADFWTNEQTHGAGAGLERRDDALSPRASIVHVPSPGWTLSFSGYRSFRAPTLNELYRGFRVGNVVTQPNGDLSAETLTGWELGTAWQPQPSVRARLIGYQMTVHDPVSNFTLEVTPELITRQRRNLGETRTRGLELDIEARRSDWAWSLGYLLSDARVVDDGVDGSLEGNRVPQIPEHQMTTQISFDRHPWGAAIQARWSGSQYEDDRNEMVLGSYTTADVRISRSFSPSVSLFVAAENVFDEEYEIGRTPVVTLGQPRTIRAGVRYSLR